MDYQDKTAGQPEILTDEMHEKAKKCLVASLSIKGTCRVIGIARSTWYGWKKRAENPKSKDDEKYIKFFKMVHTSLGDAELKLVLDIQADTTWQSKHTILKRRFNSDWGEKQEVNINQNDVVKHDFSGLSFKEKKELIKQLVLEEKEIKEANVDTE